MTENPSIEESLHNLPELSVSELSKSLKSTLEERFPRVRVRGEITGFKRAASGHMYMRLKDDDAVLDGVCWRGTAGRLPIFPEDGMEIIATGRITSYGARSSYQIVIDSMELAGEGALLKLLEDRKRKLAEEGLFEASRKKPCHFYQRLLVLLALQQGLLSGIFYTACPTAFPSALFFGRLWCKAQRQQQKLVWRLMLFQR